MKILAQLFVPLASTLVIGSLLNANSGLAATVNFQDVTQGLLRFRDDAGTQIGSGSFEYSQAPFEGTFFAKPGEYGQFVTDPSQIPEFVYPDQTISISADQNLRLVTNTNIDILGATFENQRADLSPGPLIGEVLFFQPTQNTFYPPGPGGPFGVATGGRVPGIFSGNGWFLGDEGAIPQQQLSMNPDGSFYGFDLSLVPSEELPSQNFSGKWEAEAVPEPLSVLGVASGLGFGFYFKGRRKKQTLKPKEKAKA